MIDTAAGLEVIKHIPPTISRTLVSIYIDLSHKNKQIIATYLEKINQYSHLLQTIDLPPIDIYKGYMSFWWPSLKYMAPFIYLPLHSNLLQKLH